MAQITLTEAQLETLGSALRAAYRLADEKAGEAHKAGKPITASEQRARAARLNEILKLVDAA